MSPDQDHLIASKPPLLSSRRLADLLVLAVVLLHTAMPAQETSRQALPTPAAAATVPLYTPFELRLSTTRQYGNPYFDVKVTGIFTSPSGKELRLEGFWDGGQIWRVRFAPNEAGAWNYRTESADGELQVSGSFEALSSNPAKRGFVRVSKARPYQFEYSDGTPFLLMGDTNWDGMSDGVGLNPHFKNYINLRAAQGFNAYHAIAVNNRYDYGANEGGSPFALFNSATRDYNRVNPNFFQWVDRRVAYADSAGMVSILFFMWSEEVRKMTAEQYQRFVLYVVSRCAAYNVFWILAGDYQAYFYNPPLYRQIGEAIAQADPFDHPISIHPQDGYTNREFAKEPWLSYVMHQLRDAGEFLADSIRADRVYNKPVVNGEYGYHVPESRHPYHGILQGADYTRTGGWSIFCAGGFFVAGFKHTFYDPDGHYPYDAGFDLPPVYWDLQNAKDLEAARQYGVFAKFFREQTSWPDLQPRRDLVRDGQAELLVKPGEEYVAYNARGGRMRLQLPERQYFSLAWFDPVRGVLAPSRIFESTGETVLIMPADTLDAVALLRATAAPTVTSAGRILGLRREQLNIRQVRYRWSTPEPADSRIDLQKPDGARVQFIDNKLSTEHALVIDGLAPETDYAVVISSQTNDRREWKVTAQTLRTSVVVLDEWIEAEGMPARTAGRREPPGWNLDDYGYLAVTHNFPQTGPYRFEIRARGEYRRSWPRLSLQLDGAELANFIINSAVYKDFVLQRDLASGSHEIKLAFANAGEDRQLIVDRLHLQFVRALESEPEPDSPPSSLALRHFPNPFRELALFTVDLPARGRISLKIFDLQGREVVTIIEGEKAAGQYDFAWDGTTAARQAAAAGAYFAVLRHETKAAGWSQVQVRKQKVLYLK
jgi:hypothetical protein